MAGVLEGFLVIGVVVGVGYLLGRQRVLGDQGARVLSRTAFFVATPALLFTTLAHSDVRAVLSSALVVTAVTSSLACLLFVPVALARRRPAGETVVGSMASGYVNAGNLGIPIVTYVLGNPAAVAPVLLFQLAVLTPLFTTLMDVLPGDGRGERPSWWRLVLAPARNPIAVATALGLIVSATGLRIPGPVAAPVELIADLAVPAMLLAFGISLHGARRPGTGDTGPSLWWVVAIKNVAHPLIAWGLAGGLLGLSGPPLLAAVVCAALPTAQNVFGYAMRYDRAVALARDASLTTTIVSVPVLLVVAAALA
ncbi:AEC family transporter [Pseudonocardia phyllosphaerae]|uniref:AEC family transporter n=1 Tax=Pseudonocardia phyllosphaerae TaxID=3390502 RepID=UPI00397B35B8